MDWEDCFVMIGVVIIGLFIIVALILVGARIEESYLTNKLCNKAQYDFCVEQPNYTIKVD